jgi:hypothetical protein
MTDRGEKPIGEIKVGDRVLAYNEETGETGYYTVEAVLAHEDKVIERLTVGGEGLETTPEHPFYTREHGWVPAGELAAGLHVRKADGSYALVEGIRLERRAERMFNLTVDEAHTFFVGEQQLLVHNQCGSINITSAGLAHVYDRHYPGGTLTSGKSLFYAGEDIPGLITQAGSVTPTLQANGNYAWTADAGRAIGTDRATGQSTSIYTVITRTNGDLVTAFPGYP